MAKMLRLGLICIFSLTVSFLAAQEVQTEPEEASALPGKKAAGPVRLRDLGIKGLETKVNLDTFTSWEVPQLIEYLARDAKLENIVIGKNVAGLTTKIKFKDVTVADALEVILSMNNLAYEVKGGIVTIMTDDDYKAIYGASFYDHKQVKVVTLKFADPVRLLPILDKVKSTIGTAVGDSVTGTIILIDTPEKIEEMMAIIGKWDISTISRQIPTVTNTFVLQNAKVEDMQTKITPMLTKEAGFMQADVRTKTIIVSDIQHVVEKIQTVINEFDKPSKQVFIEAKIVEVALDNNNSFGINWQHVFNGVNPRFRLESLVAPGSPLDPSASLTYNTIAGGGDLQVVLEALKSVGDTKILSSPHIFVLDGQEATIEVIENQPYKEVTLESGTTNVTGVTYKFEKVGVMLNVTPKINDNDFINVAIKPEISSISKWYNGADQEGTPVVKKAHAETTVSVKNGVTIIIGGLIQDRKDVSESSVPILGSIPLVGMLFRHQSETTMNTETVVFMTPRIVTGEEPFLRSKDMKKPPKPMRSVGGAENKQLKPVR